MWNRNENEGEVTRLSAVRRPAPEPEPERNVARIGRSVTIKGDVNSSEDLIIDGHVEGTIELSGHCLAVGVGASIVADLVGRVVTISGAVTGSISASEKVEIRETGSVDGDIRAPRVAVFEGAVLRGRVDTEQAVAAAQDDQRQLFPVAV
jgi:cytoskeletal protein CcmA (bactofilin family)